MFQESEGFGTDSPFDAGRVLRFTCGPLSPPIPLFFTMRGLKEARSDKRSNCFYTSNSAGDAATPVRYIKAAEIHHCRTFCWSLHTCACVLCTCGCEACLTAVHCSVCVCVFSFPSVNRSSVWAAGCILLVHIHIKDRKGRGTCLKTSLMWSQNQKKKIICAKMGRREEEESVEAVVSSGEPVGDRKSGSVGWKRSEGRGWMGGWWVQMQKVFRGGNALGGKKKTRHLCIKKHTPKVCNIKGRSRKAGHKRIFTMQEKKKKESKKKKLFLLLPRLSAWVESLHVDHGLPSEDALAVVDRDGGCDGSRSYSVEIAKGGAMVFLLTLLTVFTLSTPTSKGMQSW